MRRMKRHNEGTKKDFQDSKAGMFTELKTKLCFLFTLQKFIVTPAYQKDL